MINKLKMSRRNPCQYYHKKLGDFLTEYIYIPPNQRKYEWEEKNIKQYMDDIFYVFKETNLENPKGKIKN